MKRKFSFLIIFLSIIAISTVGFSSWLITHDYSRKAIDITVGAINDKNELFSFDEIKPFKFNKYGILKDDVYQENGEIYIQFKLKSNGGLSLFYEQNGFTLSFTLTSLNSVNLVDYLSDEIESVQYYVSNIKYPNEWESSPSGSCSTTIDGTNVSSILNYNNDLNDFDNYDYLYFVLVYNFDFNSVFADFEAQIYEYLIKDNSISFEFLIGIE